MKGNGISKGRGRPAYDDILTPAEWRVVHWAQHGLTNKAIATRLGISSDGVKYHMANALGKLKLQNKAALKSWFQIPKASALGKNTAERKMQKQSDTDVESLKIQSLGQVSRTVKNLAESVDFYQNKLELPHLYSFGSLAFFDVAGTRLFLNETDEVNSAESILYFSVTDIEKTCATLVARGVEVSNQPHLIHTHEDGAEEWMAFFKDLEGRALGLMCTVRK